MYNTLFRFGEVKKSFFFPLNSSSDSNRNHQIHWGMANEKKKEEETPHKFTLQN